MISGKVEELMRESTGEGESRKRPGGVLPWAGLAAGFLVIIYVPFAALDLSLPLGDDRWEGGGTEEGKRG